MNEVKFNCKVITPMFMAGADGRTPELRPSEFKGMMRFWWRAIRSEDDIKKLKKEEAEIFGGTAEGEGKSKVSIRIVNENLIKNSYRPLPHSNDKKFSLLCIKEDSVFTIVLSSLQNIDFYKNLFIISTILGGFGKRSRRGFGSIEIDGISPNIKNIHDLLCQIEKGYKIENSKIINSKKGGNYPWIEEIIISSLESKSMDEILKRIGEASHRYKDPSLGNASPRMASPVYVSVINDGAIYKPIITKLNSSYFPSSYPECNWNKQNDFIRCLL